MSTFYGFDLGEHAVEEAETNTRGLSNIKIFKHDVYKLPVEWNDKFDYILVEDVLHDLPDQELALKKLQMILKPGGRFSLVEYNIHSDPGANKDCEFAGDFYTISMFYCLSFSLHSGGHGTGIGWGIEKAEKALETVGFQIVNSTPKAGSPLERHFLCKKI